MRSEVAIVADQMFPKASLPDIPLASCAIHFRALGSTNFFHIGSGEGFFDQPPPRRVVGNVLRKFPDGMKVIGQDDLSLDFERMTASDALDRVVEHFHDFRLAEQWSAIVGNECEEIAGPVIEILR